MLLCNELPVIMGCLGEEPCPGWIGTRWRASGYVRTAVQVLLKLGACCLLSCLPHSLWVGSFNWMPISSKGSFSLGSKPSLCWHPHPPGTGQLTDRTRAGDRVQKNDRDPSEHLTVHGSFTVTFSKFPTEGDLGRLMPAAAFTTLQSRGTTNGSLVGIFGPSSSRGRLA